MSLETILGTSASVFSIISALWAFYSAKSATKAKKELLEKKKIVVLSSFSETSKITITQVRKIAFKRSVERGVNISEILDSLINYYECLNNLCMGLEVNDLSDISNFKKDISETIDVISSLDRNSENKLIEHYTKIYYAIQNLGNITHKLNNNIIKN